MHQKWGGIIYWKSVRVYSGLWYKWVHLKDFVFGPVDHGKRKWGSYPTDALFNGAFIGSCARWRGMEIIKICVEPVLPLKVVTNFWPKILSFDKMDPTLVEEEEFFAFEISWFLKCKRRQISPPREESLLIKRVRQLCWNVFVPLCWIQKMYERGWESRRKRCKEKGKKS